MPQTTVRTHLDVTLDIHRDFFAEIAFNRAFFWTDERATLPYDLWVIAILAFVWLTPPDWLGDPMAHGPGLIGLIRSRLP